MFEFACHQFDNIHWQFVISHYYCLLFIIRANDNKAKPEFVASASTLGIQ